MPTVLLATRNAGKLREIERLLPAATIEWRTLAEFPGVPDAPEHGETFAENARDKALYYAAATGLLTLADDSGLAVDALGGAPGVQSARYGGVPRSDARNNLKLIEALRDVAEPDRTARFHCAIALAERGRVLAESRGAVEGVITDEPRGENGFGYDPHFLIPQMRKTMAQLPADEKGVLSHRGVALRAILPELLACLASA